MPKKSINATVFAGAAVAISVPDGTSDFSDYGCHGLNEPLAEHNCVGTGWYRSPYEFDDTDDKCVWEGLTENSRDPWWQCGWQSADLGGCHPAGTISQTHCRIFNETDGVCDSYYLDSGAVFRPQDHPFYFSTPGGYADRGCIPSNNTGPEGLLGASVAGTTRIKVLTDGCRNALGLSYKYKDNTGNDMSFNGADVIAWGGSPTNIASVRTYYKNVVLGSPGPVAYPVGNAYPHWIIEPSIWDNGFGACKYPQVFLYDSSFASTLLRTYTNVWAGCPSDFSEWMAANRINKFYNTYGFVQDRERSVRSNLEPASYNATGGIPAFAGSTHGKCYDPGSLGACPNHYELNVVTGKCIPERLAPICPPGYTFVGGSPGNCVASGDEYLYGGYVSFARGMMGQLGVTGGKVLRQHLSPVSPGFTIYRYGDTLPEYLSTIYQVTINAVSQEDVACPNIHRRRTGQWDIFYIRARKVLGSNVYDVRYCYSRDNLRTMGGRTDAAFDTMTMTQVFQGGGYYNVQCQTVIENTDYVKIRVHYDDKRNVLILLGWRANAWYIRTGTISKSNVVALDAERLLVSTEDNTSEAIESTGNKDYLFTYYNTAGELRLLRLTGIVGTGTLDTIDQSLLDALAAEYYSFGLTLLEKQGMLVLVVWKPNVLGTWDGSSSRQGKLYCRVGTWNGSAWVFSVERDMGIGDTAIVSPMLKHTVRGIELNYNAGASYICPGLKSDGTGTWSRI